MSGPRGSTSSLSEDDGDDQGFGISCAEAIPVKEALAREGSSALTDDKIAPSPQLARSPLHLQKRRRVTRACDECRRKKIKCDGKQPCTHCTVYSYECTYDQPSNRRRNPAPEYIEALESRLQRAETVLKTVLPDVDLDDPNLAAAVMQHALMVEKSPEGGLTHVESSSTSSHQVDKLERDQDSLLESMVDNTGSLDLDDEGYWGFHGHSSGLVFLRRIRKQFGDLIEHPEGHGLPSLTARNLTITFGSPRSGGDSPDPIRPNLHDLPSKESARGLCEHALDDACASFPFIHKPTFYRMLDKVYSASPENFGNEENRFLPLMYATMALGCLFAKAEQSPLQLHGYGGAIDQGFQWLKSSRKLMEITDCRDLTSLQTILVVIFFLQSSARLNTCYSHIGIAVTSSLRMGLHRSVPVAFNPIEHEVRKRIFWTIRKLDIYIGALLGLPEMLSDDNIDQEMPLEVDDEFITVEGVLPMPSGRISSMVAFNAHTRLVHILAKTVKYIYPIKGLAHASNKSNQSYAVNHAHIREIEQDLHEWMEKLPMLLRPGGDPPPQLLRIQQNLRIAYAHLQMFLYRPFLHYASADWQSNNIDKRSYACAAACVNVSRNIVHITGDMNRRGLLIGWFYMYTTFFAIMTLVFFVLENPSSSTSTGILRDAYEGKDTLASLAKGSMAADRCTVTLASLFKQLPQRLNEAVSPNSSPNKRRASLSDTLASSTSIPVASGAFSRPGHEQNGGAHSQQFILTQEPNEESGYHPSAPHKVTTFDHGASSRITDDYPHLYSNDYRRPAGAVESPTLLNAHSSGPSNATQPILTTSQNFASTGFAGISAMMFPSADPFAYPMQPMSSIENNNPIKREDRQDPSRYDRFSTITESGAPHAQLIGAYALHLTPGQHPDVSAEAQYMHSFPEMNHQKSSNHTMMPTEAVGSGWTYHQAQSDVPQVSQGMNYQHLAAGGWSPAWIHHGS